MSSGNADLGAGLTQTRGKKVDEAKHLASHQRDTLNDMRLPIGGLALAVVTGSMLTATLFGFVSVWVSFGSVVMFLLMAVCVSLVLRMKRDRNRDAALAQFRSNSDGSSD